MIDGEYVDLSLNPERFTGYAGDSAHQVWRAIYEENCFGLSEAGSAPAPIGFSKLSEGFGTEMVRHDEECEEKRVYYRIISGESMLQSYFAAGYKLSVRPPRIYFITHLSGVSRPSDWRVVAKSTVLRISPRCSS